MISKEKPMYHNREERQLILKLFYQAREQYINQELLKHPDKILVDYMGTEPYHTINKIYNKYRLREELDVIEDKSKEMK